jgi:hypothetical protein
MSPLLTRVATPTAAVAVYLALAACQNAATEPTGMKATSPQLAIADAAYGGGDARFLWLPPTVPRNPSYGTTVFASGLTPTVTVCAGAVTSCPNDTVAHFTRGQAGTGGAVLVENSSSPSYRVTWLSSSCDARAVQDPPLTKHCPLKPGDIYRMSVTDPSMGGTVLGYADIKIYRTLIEQYQDPLVKQYVPLLQGRPIGIAFRIAQ